MEHRTALASGKLHEDHIKLEPDLGEVTPLDRIDFACHTVRKLTSNRLLVRMVLSSQLLVVEADSMSDGRYTILQMAILCANCRPFSRYGDRKGLQDTRARSLTGGLRLTYLIQAWAIVMENVKGTFDFPGVMAILNQYVLLLDWEWNKLDMDLAQQWTSRRERTWALLAAWMGVTLLPWPTLASPPPPTAWGALGKQWSEEDEQELLLTPEEIALYLDEFQGQNYHVEHIDRDPAATGVANHDAGENMMVGFEDITYPLGKSFWAKAQACTLGLSTPRISAATSSGCQGV